MVGSIFERIGCQIPIPDDFAYFVYSHQSGFINSRSSHSHKTSLKWKSWRNRQHTSRSLKVHRQHIYHLLNRIWNEESIPDNWYKGLLVKLPKKGDTSLYNNWRGITLRSIPSKVLCSIKLSRINKEEDKNMRDGQALRFRQERLCVDQIAT